MDAMRLSDDRASHRLAQQRPGRQRSPQSAVNANVV